VAIKVSTEQPLPVDGHWRHIFFTYDGSGKASGITIYIDGSPVKTRTVADTLAQSTIRTQAPMQLGWRSPDANPLRETRYQDIRLYARALTADEARRLPLEDYVAEVTAKPIDKWNPDELHAASKFYFANIDQSAKMIATQISQLNARLDKLSEGGDLTLVSWGSRRLLMPMC